MSNKHVTFRNSILIKTAIALTIILMNFGVTGAEDVPATDPPATPPATTPATTPTADPTGRDQYKSFPVTKYLTVGETPYTTGKQEQKYLKTDNPAGAFILQAINLIALTAASLSFLAIVIAGFMMITAAGNENQLNKGKEVLQRAILGLVITLSAYFIVSFVQNLLFETAAK